MIKINSRVQVKLPGRYNGETGEIIEIFPVKDSSKVIYKIRIDACIYDPIETLLIEEDYLITI